MNQICFDETAEFIASCSDDGSVSVSKHQEYPRIFLMVLGDLAPSPCHDSAMSSTSRKREDLCGPTPVLVTVQVQGFYTDDSAVFKYKRPVKVSVVHSSSATYYVAMTLR